MERRRQERIDCGDATERELEHIDRSGLTETTDKGNVIQRALVGIANKAKLDVIKCSIEFGMTPSARARVSAAPPESEDKYSEFFGN